MTHETLFTIQSTTYNSYNTTLTVYIVLVLVYCFAITECTNANYYYLKTLMARKPKGSHRAYKEWAPSVKYLEQSIHMGPKSMAELQ